MSRSPTAIVRWTTRMARFLLRAARLDRLIDSVRGATVGFLAALAEFYSILADFRSCIRVSRRPARSEWRTAAVEDLTVRAKPGRTGGALSDSRVPKLSRRDPDEPLEVSGELALVR